MPKPGSRLPPLLLTRPHKPSDILRTPRRGAIGTPNDTVQTRSHFVAVMTIPPRPTTAVAGYSGSNYSIVGSTFGNSMEHRRPETVQAARSSSSGGVNAANVSGGAEAESKYGFALSPVPSNPLGEGRCIRTAAALVIGDEILNGKTMEKNSHYFAKFCFDFGIDLKRIEVVADDEQEIIEASRRMVAQYDFVITTGGIGPTHDDITYASLAKAFNQNLVHHPETIRRMDMMNRHRAWVASQNPQQKEATKRMALFPDRAEVLFVGRDIWVPVVRLEGKLCVFPGIPALFQKMLNGLKDFLPLPPACDRPKRVQIFTERPESMIAPYLTSLQARLKPCDIQVGSYPVLGKGVFVSLIGRRDTSEPSGPRDGPLRSQICLSDVAAEVEREIGGRVASEEEVAKKKAEARTSDPDGVAAASIAVQAGLGSESVPKARI
ncbi:hypothetical protein D9758_005393 [Tetrapyrgos nigripes]|uniref:MoaB/Mog domain-containing protein n=1 Tax=Tetrapyrgos nigripes TaxID=182062 RepID=A0A8H5GHM4_9AGAR|nr:hypothetical protein D9758_005393 [Tetrapyrgos nigripes]